MPLCYKAYMRKWMRERMKRRKKPEEKPGSEPKPAPLQPAYFDADAAPPTPDETKPEIAEPAGSSLDEAGEAPVVVSLRSRLNPQAQSKSRKQPSPWLLSANRLLPLLHPRAVLLLFPRPSRTIPPAEWLCLQSACRVPAKAPGSSAARSPRYRAICCALCYSTMRRSS